MRVNNLYVYYGEGIADYRFIETGKDFVQAIDLNLDAFPTATILFKEGTTTILNLTLARSWSFQ